MPFPDVDTQVSKLSDLLTDALTPHKGQNVQVGTLIDALHERGFGILLILFSLPLCIPVPKPPPVDTILGLPLFYLCWQMIVGQDTPSLPAKLRAKTLSGDLLSKVMDKGGPYVRKFETLFKPRTLGFSEESLSKICGIFGMILTCSVMIPFPFSNTMPSICMIVMAMGLMSRDTVAALAAGTFGTLWIAMLTYLAVSGAAFFSQVLI